MDIIYEVEKAGRQPLHSFERQNIKTEDDNKIAEIQIIKNLR